MSLVFYSFFALLPIITIFLLLVIARRPASQVMPVAYIVTVVIALLLWQVPRSSPTPSFLKKKQESAS